MTSLGRSATGKLFHATGPFIDFTPFSLVTCPLVTYQGLYDAAFDVLKSAAERFPSSSSREYSAVWMSCEQHVTFTASLHRGRLCAAERALNNLAAVDRLQADFW